MGLRNYPIMIITIVVRCMRVEAEKNEEDFLMIVMYEYNIIGLLVLVPSEVDEMEK